jgi:hypothetical protein
VEDELFHANGRKDGQTDRHEKAMRRFSQFCEKRLEIYTTQLKTFPFNYGRAFERQLPERQYMYGKEVNNVLTRYRISSRRRSHLLKAGLYTFHSLFLAAQKPSDEDTFWFNAVIFQTVTVQ